MATLTNEDFTAIKKLIKRDPAYRETFKLWGLDKQTWEAAFQQAEDWFVAGFLTAPPNSFKAAIEVQTGAATNAQIKALGWNWMAWRVPANP